MNSVVLLLVLQVVLQVEDRPVESQQALDQLHPQGRSPAVRKVVDTWNYQHVKYSSPNSHTQEDGSKLTLCPTTEDFGLPIWGISTLTNETVRIFQLLPVFTQMVGVVKCSHNSSEILLAKCIQMFSPIMLYTCQDDDCSDIDVDLVYVESGCRLLMEPTSSRSKSYNEIVPEPTTHFQHLETEDITHFGVDYSLIVDPTDITRSYSEMTTDSSIQSGVANTLDVDPTDEQTIVATTTFRNDVTPSGLEATTLHQNLQTDSSIQFGITNTFDVDRTDEQTLVATTSLRSAVTRSNLEATTLYQHLQTDSSIQSGVTYASDVDSADEHTLVATTTLKDDFTRREESLGEIEDQTNTPVFGSTTEKLLFETWARLDEEISDATTTLRPFAVFSEPAPESESSTTPEVLPNTPSSDGHDSPEQQISNSTSGFGLHATDSFVATETAPVSWLEGINQGQGSTMDDFSTTDMPATLQPFLPLHFPQGSYDPVLALINDETRSAARSAIAGEPQTHKKKLAIELFHILKSKNA